jgi:hypothetical protein
MPEYENQIYLSPGNEIPREFPDLGLSPLPGRACVWMHQPKTYVGGYEFHTNGRLNPDCGVVVTECTIRGVTLPAGTPVAVRPYSGAWHEYDGGEYRLFLDANEDVLLYWGGDWKSFPGRVLATREEVKSALVTLHETRHVGHDEQGQRVIFEELGIMDVPLLKKVLSNQVFATVE